MINSQTSSPTWRRSNYGAVAFGSVCVVVTAFSVLSPRRVCVADYEYIVCCQHISLLPRTEVQNFPALTRFAFFACSLAMFSAIDASTCCCFA